MTAPIPDALAQYLAGRDQQRAATVEARFAELTPREQWLVREAAVMGYVQGARTEPGEQVPASTVIVHAVIEECQARASLYPVLAGSVRHLVRRLVYCHQPLPLQVAIESTCALTTLCGDEVEQVINGLTGDEELVEMPDGLREVTG